MQKFDPYINIDPGTMKPVQHGGVFVTDDGGETDLDRGHYERFIDESLSKNSNVTTGKIYWSVLQKKRRGDFGGEPSRSFPISPMRSRTGSTAIQSQNIQRLPSSRLAGPSAISRVSLS